MMRIAQVAPLMESISNKYFAETERDVANLTEALLEQGHQVTLFTNDDSNCNEYSVAGVDASAWLKSTMVDPLLDQFDIVHFHVNNLNFLWPRQINTASITTVHGRLDISQISMGFDQLSNTPLVSVSESQRRSVPDAGWKATIHNGVVMDKYKYKNKPGNYLAYLGRMSPQHGLEQAIDLALRVGIKLKILATLDRLDQAYYEKTIKPLLLHPLIEYIGEINDIDKSDFLGNAFVTLFPVDWPDPLSRSMIESMACGTPVISFNSDMASEVLLNGETGFIVDSTEEAINAMDKLDSISRQCCRYIFENRFSSSQNALDYLKVYQSLLGYNEIQTPIAM